MVLFAIAAVCAIVTTVLPIAEVTWLEDRSVDADAATWLAVALTAGVAPIIAGSVVRCRGMLGSVIGDSSIMLGTLASLAAGAVALFGIDVVIDMWDSDAGGRPGVGRTFAVAAAVSALVGLVVDLVSRRPTVPPR